MQSFPKNLKALYKSKGLTQQKFAESIGVSITTVNGWLNRGVQPKTFYIDEICRKYDVSHDDLLSEENGFYRKINGLTNAPAGAIAVTPAPARMVPVRVLGAVHAADPDEPWELDGEAMLYESLAERHPGCFALEVNGDCMDEVFTDADYVFVDPAMEPRDGSIAVVLADGETVVRRVRMGSDSMMLVSESHAGSYPDIVVGRGAECLGVVFWWQARAEAV